MCKPPPDQGLSNPQFPGCEQWQMKKNVGERVMDQMAEMYQKNWEKRGV